MEVFKHLGDSVEAAWRSVDYDEERFPSIAAEFLRNEGLPSKMSPWDVLEWGLAQTQLPRQKDVRGNFGDPPITVYTAPKFFIDVYFWFEGTTAIHQHSFCGGFQVLHGSSIHSWYDFHREESINVFTEIGTMSLKSCELLETGAVQEINSGRRYIHALFHLDSPSATICVRTDKSPVHLPQFSYHKPSLALDPFYEDETLTKKLQMISAMLRADRPNADEHIGKLLEDSDFQSTYSILGMLRPALSSNQIERLFNAEQPKLRFDRFVEIAQKRHGKKIDLLMEVFASRDRTGEIIHRRSFIKDPEHRFFFALLLNVDGKQRIFDLINQRYPEANPIEKVLDWVFDLSQTRVLASNHQNGLGIHPFDDLDMLIFEQLLRDRTDDEITSSINAEYPPEKLTQTEETLPDRIAKIKNAVVFGPLFSQ
jgi:hypothetical protein